MRACHSKIVLCQRTHKNSYKEVFLKYSLLPALSGVHVYNGQADMPIVIVPITNSKCNTTRSMYQADYSMAYMIH